MTKAKYNFDDRCLFDAKHENEYNFDYMSVKKIVSSL